MRLPCRKCFGCMRNRNAQIEMYDVENYSNVDYNEHAFDSIHVQHSTTDSLDKTRKYFDIFYSLVRTSNTIYEIQIYRLFSFQKHNCMGRFMNSINIHMILAGKKKEIL